MQSILSHPDGDNPSLYLKNKYKTPMNIIIDASDNIINRFFIILYKHKYYFTRISFSKAFIAFILNGVCIVSTCSWCKVESFSVLCVI